MRIFWSAAKVAIHYSVISVTTPAPTVRPPSRIANRNSFSIATGVIRSLVIVTLPPRLSLSAPAGHATPPRPSLRLRGHYGPGPVAHHGCSPPLPADKNAPRGS